MKSKKLFLPTVIMLAAIFAITVFCIINGIAQKPTVTEGEFPFSITYEFNGETVTIEDIYSAHYYKNDGYTNTKSRFYVGKIGNLPEGETLYTLKEGENGSIFLSTEFYADYLMGDPLYDYFDDEEFAPKILSYDFEGNEDPSAAQSVKIISWEYPTPIENTLVFSHISCMDGEVVLPTLIISILALLATIIFVKKDKDFVRKPIDVVSTVFNFLICIVTVPFFTISGWLLDALGDNDHIVSQIFFLLAAFTVLGIALSVALRRKGYGKSGLLAQFIVPAIFALIMFIY